MNGTQTPLSLNEVRFFFTRAAVGAGTPFGLGEDFAKAAIWLASLGSDPASVVAPALRSLANGESDSKTISRQDETVTRYLSSESKPLSSIYAGPVVADWLGVAAAASKDARVVLENVDQPALIPAYVAAVQINGGLAKITWESTGGNATRIEIDSDGVNVFAEKGQMDFITCGPCDVVVALSRKTSSSDSSGTTEVALSRPDIVKEGVNVGAEPWAIVFGFFRKCLVPSSDKSRQQGAGAGLTDND